VKKLSLLEHDFNPLHLKRFLVHDSPYFKILNFNLKAGQELPVHSHEVEGQLSLLVLEGRGVFLGKEGHDLPAEAGDVVIAEISEPHGIRAHQDMRVVVTIAPPI